MKKITVYMYMFIWSALAVSGFAGDATSLARNNINVLNIQEKFQIQSRTHQSRINVPRVIFLVVSLFLT